MATVLTPPQTKPPSGGPPPPIGPGGDGSRGGGRSDDGWLLVGRYKTGMWFALASITMVFAGFVSAYVVRKGISNDWRPMHVPSILWVNTAVLLASSVTMEMARRRRPQTWLAVTSVLGALFLGGQILAWRQLRAAGIYIASNPSSSFFYLLTGAHGLHLFGGVLALFYVAARVWLDSGWRGRSPAVEATSLYWHFMDGLWIFVFLLVFLWR